MIRGLNSVDNICKYGEIIVCGHYWYSVIYRIPKDLFYRKFRQMRRLSHSLMTLGRDIKIYDYCCQRVDFQLIEIKIFSILVCVSIK